MECQSGVRAQATHMSLSAFELATPHELVKEPQQIFQLRASSHVLVHGDTLAQRTFRSWCDLGTREAQRGVV